MICGCVCHLPLRLTSREWARRKSAPCKGRVTSAVRIFCLYVLEEKWRESVRVPYVFMILPLAAARGRPFCLMQVSSPVAGRTLTSASVSTRKCLFEELATLSCSLSTSAMVIAELLGRGYLALLLGLFLAGRWMSSMMSKPVSRHTHRESARLAKTR